MIRAERCYRSRTWINPVSVVVRLRKGAMVAWHDPDYVRALRAVLANTHVRLAVPRMNKP